MFLLLLQCLTTLHSEKKNEMKLIIKIFQGTRGCYFCDVFLYEGASEPKFVTSPVYRFHKYVHALQALAKQAEEREEELFETSAKPSLVTKPLSFLQLLHFENPVDSLQLRRMGDMGTMSLKAKKKAREQSFISEQFISHLPKISTISSDHHSDPAWQTRNEKIAFENLDKLFSNLVSCHDKDYFFI